MNNDSGITSETLTLAGGTVVILSLLLGGLVLFNVIPGGACSAVGGLQLICAAFLLTVGAAMLLLGIVLRQRSRRRNTV